MRSPMSRMAFLLLTVASVVVPFSAAAADFDLRGQDGLEKIARYPEPDAWRQLPRGLALELVRGESESGQVALRAGNAMRLSGLRVEAPNLCHQATGEALPPGPEPIYMVAFINPLEPDPANSMWPAIPGVLDQPDPLVPVPDRLELAEGETLTLWLTVRAPHGARPGRYRGELRLHWRGLGGPLSVPVQVTVHDAALPTNTRVQTQLFSLVLGEVARFARVDPTTDEARWREITGRCVDLHRNYRISPYSAALYGIGSNPSLVPGRFGGGWSFDGHMTTASLDLPPAIVDGGPFAVMAWLRPRTDDERTQFVWSCWGRGEGMRLELRTGGQVGLYASPPGSGRTTLDLEAPLGAEGWHHVAVSSSPAGVTLFVDGVERAAQADEMLTPVSAQVILGSYPHMSSNLYAGDLDEFRFFDRALDAEAVAAEMARAGAQSDAPVNEPMDVQRPGGVSPYTDQGAELLQAWWQLWRSEGLHIGNVTAPGAYKWDRVDFRTADAFFSRHYPWLEAEGALAYSYTRMPVDEALIGRGYDVNVSYGRWLGEHYPGLNRHHTIGDHADDAYFDEVMAYAGALDIWDITPGVWDNRGHRLVAALEERRQQLGERFAWYMTRTSPVLRNGVPIPPLGLRGFFWQMMKHEVSMPSHWCVNLWDPETGKHSGRDLRWEKASRSYRFRRSTSAGVASATFLWPTADGPVPSIRWATIRDGIEDFDLWWQVREGARAAREQGVAIAGLEEALGWIDEAPLELVGLLGFSTHYGDVEQFRARRAELIRLAVRLEGAGLLPPPEELPEPPVALAPNSPAQESVPFSGKPVGE